MTSLIRILLFGILFCGSHSFKAQNIDSSYLGTYAVIHNCLEYDTVGYLKINSNQYIFSAKGSNRVYYNRNFMNNVTGEYAIKNYGKATEKDSLNHYTIDFDPKNHERSWSLYLHSTLSLTGSNSAWHLKDNTSRSFPQYIFYKTE